MSKKYFSGLNYTLGNEDTTIEFKMTEKLRPKSIFSICGSGGRALPLLTSDAEFIALGDLSIEQLHLAALRNATYHQLSYDDFLKFWGYFPYRADDNKNFRKITFYQLKLDMEVKSFFEKVFLELDFDSVLYLGKWERTFSVLAKINRTLLGENFDKILKFDDLSDQIAYYQSQFPLNKWRAVIFLLGNKSMFNALLYKGDFIEKNSKLSHFDYYFNAFNRLFTGQLAKESFFLHLCFYGKINSLEGVPVEASKAAFDRVNKATAQINYVCADFVSYLSKGEKTFDFLSLSDDPSYFKGNLERDFMQKIRPSLNKNAVIVVRYYLRVSFVDLTGFTDVTSAYQELIDREKVQMYDIRVYQYNS